MHDQLCHVTDSRAVQELLSPLPGSSHVLSTFGLIYDHYFSLLFLFQGIHSRGDSRHLSGPLASVIPVTTNACSLTSVSVTVIFYGMGSLAPSPTLLFYPGLVPAEHTHTGMDYPHRDKYTQVAIIEGQEFRKTRKH